MHEVFKPISDTIKNEIFLKEITNRGGEVYFVGGCVRDCFLNKKSKDIDIVVRLLSFDFLENLLSNLGKVTVTTVGDKFKVIKFVSKITNNDYDIALPRIEHSTGIGHDEFDVFSDPNIPIENDLFRRDFTINAIALDSKFRIIDPYGGIFDLINKIIRVISKDSFIEDPLRMLRGIQFVSRFEGFKIDDYTFEQIIKNRKLILSITKERIREELDKIYHKGSPFIGFEYMSQTGLSYLLFNNHSYSIRDRFKIGAGTYEDFYFRIFYDENSNVDIGDVYMKLLSGEKRVADILRSIKELLEFSSDNTADAMFMIYEHNKYFTELALSNVLKYNKNITHAFSLFMLYGESYPKSLKELVINGNDILPYVDNNGILIGRTLRMLMMKIYKDEINNEKEILLEEAKKFIKNELINIES